MPSHLLIFAPASAWSCTATLHITCLSPTSLHSHPALLHMCRDAGYKKLIEWGLPSHLLIFAPASAWSLLHITCLSPSSLSALLHMCRDAGYKKLIEWGLPSHLLIFAPASAWSLLHITCLSPTSLSALLHMCRDAGYKKLIEWGLPSHLLIFAPASHKLGHYEWGFLTCFMFVSILFVCTATHVP